MTLCGRLSIAIVLFGDFVDFCEVASRLESVIFVQGAFSLHVFLANLERFGRRTQFVRGQRAEVLLLLRHFVHLLAIQASLFTGTAGLERVELHIRV